MAADPEPGAPPLGPERSRESLPDESLDLDARAVESPRTEPQDPAGDVSHARGVDDALRSARHQVVTSATPSHGSSVIDAVVDAAVAAERAKKARAKTSNAATPATLLVIAHTTRAKAEAHELDVYDEWFHR